MKCDFCGEDFNEKLIEESHDVPCKLFLGEKRNIRKNQADKCGRHWLCVSCHKTYEAELNSFLQKKAKEFSNDFYQANEKENKDDTNTKTTTK